MTIKKIKKICDSRWFSDSGARFDFISIRHRIRVLSALLAEKVFRLEPLVLYWLRRCFALGLECSTG